MFQVEIFWVVTSCSFVVGYQCFRGPCCLHLQDDVTTQKTSSSNITAVKASELTLSVRVVLTHKFYGMFIMKKGCLYFVKLHTQNFVVLLHDIQPSVTSETKLNK